MRQTAFGDVQPRKNLIAGRKRKLDLLGKNVFDVQHTVDAEAQYNTLFLRFQVNVARALFDGQGENIVCETYDGRVFRCGGQVRC